MYNYNILVMDFLQEKRNTGYKYGSDEIILKEIAKFLEDSNVEIITKEVIENYARVNPNLKQNTLARNMGVFREFNKYLAKQDIECYQIPDKIYPQNHHNYIPHIFTYDEIKKIYSNLNCIYNSPNYTYYYKTIYPLIIKLLYQTGMRISEVLNITFDDYKNNSLILRNTKNGESRRIVVPKTLRDELNSFSSKYHYDNSNKLFVANSNAVRIYFKKVLKNADIKITDNGPRIHDLRHTYVVHTIEKFRKEGKDMDKMLEVLKTQLGHKSLESLSYYFHLNNNVLDELCNISNSNFNYLIPEVSDDDE